MKSLGIQKHKKSSLTVPLPHIPNDFTGSKLNEVTKPQKTKKNLKNSSLIPKSLKAPFPSIIKPMLSTLVDEIPKGKDWIYEVKWDGYRAVAYCKKNEINILSRNNKSFNDKFYPIVQQLKKLKFNAVFDGEIVVLKDTGVTSFGDLQNWRSEADGELAYYIFDLLWLNGYNLMGLPLTKRKELLKSLIPAQGSIKESTSFDLSLVDFLKAVKKMGLEGIIAKQANSLYLPGIRGYDWVKLKVQNKHEVVIGGYTRNVDSPKPFSSLLVGVYKNHILEYTGKIGTGFNDQMQIEMMVKFKKLVINKSPFLTIPDINKPSRFRPNPPLAKAIWLSPKLVCEVTYTEMTKEGVMRHPSFKGMREDKNPLEVNEEIIVHLGEIPKKNLLKLSPIKIKERKSLLNPSEETQVKKIKGHSLKFIHLSKIFWPKERLTKRDLLNYYYQVAPYILPYLKNRPQSLNRFPNGIKGISFYQKDVTASAPEWIKKFPYRTSEGEDKNFLVVQDEADVLWMANLGAIEMNPWNSTIDKPDNPNWCLIDIDPTEKNSFDNVIEVALTTKQVLDALKIEGYCKTSGATGMHIYIPMGAQYTYDQCQLFARLIATKVHELLPKFTSIERFTINRKDKIYVDFLQNRPKATLAAPYSVRPKPGAPISMPLHWDEVKKGLRPLQFNLKNAIQRIKNEGDLFKPVIGNGINLERALKILENLQV